MIYNCYTGALDILIDTFPHCLQNNDTGLIVRTVVRRILLPDVDLEDYTEKTGWFVDWTSFPDDVEIYAIIAIEDQENIQGLLGVKLDDEWECARLVWGCSAPWNTPAEVPNSTGEQLYDGVGAHIFAAAHRYSLAMGYGGGISGYAVNRKVLDHYIEEFGAIPHPEYGGINPFFFTIPNAKAEPLYSYDFIWED